MLALTIRQPWASAIAAGIKRIENRSWRPASSRLPLRIAFHAGSGLDRDRFDFCRARGFDPGVDLPRGAIVAVATIVEVVERSSDPWFMGPLGWVLGDIDPIDPIACSGRLGFWTVPDPIVARLTTHLRAA